MDYSDIDIIKIITLNGIIYHMRIPLYSQFDLIRDYFEDNPTQTKIHIPIYKEGLINLFKFYDSDGDVRLTLNQWREALIVADYMNVNKYYLNQLLESFYYNLTGNKLTTNISIRNAIGMLN